MKYMMMMFGDAGTMMEERDPQWVRDMIKFMTDIDQEWRATGELVAAEGLDMPSAAKVVSLVDGQVVVTDGPYAEAKESLAGFWILDVKDEARLLEMAAQIVPWSRSVEIRAVPAGPPEV
jgi:hypothetical protein